MPVHSLNFAVLDGDEPATKEPWGAGKPSFSALSTQCGKMVFPPEETILGKHCRALLVPNLVPFANVLEDPQRHLIVGVIVDLVSEAITPCFLQERQDAISNLCFSMQAAGLGQPLPSKKLGFELILLIDPAQKAATFNWGTTVKAIVKGCLNTDVTMTFLRDPAIFEDAVEIYLTRAVDRLMEGAD